MDFILYKINEILENKYYQIPQELFTNEKYKDTLKVGNITVSHFKILDKLQLIVKENLIELLNILKNMDNIQNAKNYLMICLYNNLVNTYMGLKQKL